MWGPFSTCQISEENRHVGNVPHFDMSSYRLISVDERSLWQEALARCGDYDSYHLPGYHAVADQQGEGEPLLFFFEHKRGCAALPLLIRPVGRVSGLERCRRLDAVSVYGYPGLLSSIGASNRSAGSFRRQFADTFRQAMERLGLVSIFVRQNPMIDSSWLFSSLGEVTTQGPAVAIDLTRPDEEQLAAMRHGHRSDVRRARNSGMTVYEDPDFDEIGQFSRLYNETMDRVGAASNYYFPMAYYENLRQRMGEKVKLVFCEKNGRIISGAIFLLNMDVIQYHLSGTPNAHLGERGASKLILDEMRTWGAENGFKWLHLGGGLGAREDSLYHFKAGFSKTRFSFSTVKMVIRAGSYRQLLGLRDQWDRANGLAPSADGFFPEYRRPYPEISPRRVAA
jgi:hypothetical protein